MDRDREGRQGRKDPARGRVELLQHAAPGDRRGDSSLGRNLALVEKLRPFAARAGRTVAEVAIAWVLRRPEVTAAIVGGRRPEHVAETIRAADWDLSPEEIAEVDALVAAREAQG
ncbi:MAG: aldo/keto reductase [Spirochaetes bacterium]|nr:aldo/keto reductase [Spirochaetota bacterium]